MKIGFTGTQKGMTEWQLDHVKLVMGHYNMKSGYKLEAHHGGCVGADAQFHNVCHILGVEPIVHMALDVSPKKQAKLEFVGSYVSALPALKRNNNIVDSVDIMIATPAQNYEILRSGTWATIRYAKKVGRVIHVIYPYPSRILANK